MGDADFQLDPTGVMAHLVSQNQTELGEAFKKVLAGLKTWRERRVLALFSRLDAYKVNDIQKLLEFADDLTKAHDAQIKFYGKYQGELFIYPDVADREFEETKFLDEVILPILNRLADRRGTT